MLEDWTASSIGSSISKPLKIVVFEIVLMSSLDQQSTVPTRTFFLSSL